MHAELSFYIHLNASMGSTAAAGWSRQREDTAAQCDSLCSAVSTVSSLSMLLCDGRDSSVSSAATPAGASFSWECAQHGYSFGGKLNSLQSRAGQQRSHPYCKAVLVDRASSPPAVQGFDNMKSLHHVPPSRELAESSADAGARSQVCDRAQRLRARLHTMHSCSH